MKDQNQATQDAKYSKGKEFFKAIFALYIVFLLGGAITVLVSEMIGSVILFAGTMAVVRMLVVVFKGGKAFD